MTLGVFALISSEFLPVSLLSPIAGELRLTVGQAGQAISATAVIAMISSLVIPLVAGTVNRRHIMLALLVALIVSGVLVSSAPNYLIFMLGRSLLGIALGGFAAMSAAIVMRLVSADTVGKALATTNVGNALASVIAAPVGSYIGGVIGWRGAYACTVALSLAALVWLFFTLPQLPARTSASRMNVLQLLRQPVLRRGLLAIALLYAGQFGLYIYIRPFLERVTQVQLSTISVMLFVVGCSGLVGTAIIGRILDRHLTALVVVLPLLMAATAVSFTLFGASPVAMTIMLAMWGFVAMAAPIGWFTWITQAAPEDAEAAGGLVVAVAQLAIMLGASLGGVLFDYIGPIGLYLTCATVLLMAALAARFSMATGTASRVGPDPTLQTL